MGIGVEDLGLGLCFLGFGVERGLSRGVMIDACRESAG